MGFLGRATVTDVVAHAWAFVPPTAGCSAILDLGSGAGVPGLVLAAAHPAASVTLLDSSQRRTDWLRRAVSRLGWSARVGVVQCRAEELGHEPQWRSSQHAVVARSFAPPLVTAECAAPFLKIDGRLVVSEPPAPVPGRWPTDPLDELGLVAVEWPDPTVAVMTQVRPCPEAVPRGRVVRGHTY